MKTPTSPLKAIPVALVRRNSITGAIPTFLLSSPSTSLSHRHHLHPHISKPRSLEVRDDGPIAILPAPAYWLAGAAVRRSNAVVNTFPLFDLEVSLPRAGGKRITNKDTPLPHPYHLRVNGSRRRSVLPDTAFVLFVLAADQEAPNKRTESSSFPIMRKE